MQSLDQFDGYTEQEVKDVLHGKRGPRNVRFRYDVLDIDFRKKATLEHVMEGEVSMAAFSRIKRTAKFKIEEEYIPEHYEYFEDNLETGYETRAQLETGTLTDMIGGDEGTSGVVRLPIAPLSQVTNWNMETNSSWTSAPTGYTLWGSARCTGSNSSYSISGTKSHRCIRTASGTIGLQTSSNPVAITGSGMSLQASALVAHTDQSAQASYTYLLMTDGGGSIVNDSYTRVNTGLTHPGGGQWYLYRWYFTVPSGRSGFANLLIGTSGGATGYEMRIDNVHFRNDNAPAIYEGSWISPAIDMSKPAEAQGTFQGGTFNYVWYLNASFDDSPTSGKWFQRYSTDDGVSWTSWSEITTGSGSALNIPIGTSLTGLKYQVKAEVGRWSDRRGVGVDSINVTYDLRYLDLVEETTKINYLQDKIQPFMEFEMPDKQWISFSLGIFYPTTPARTEGKDSVYREIEAYDGLIVLDEDKFTTRYTIAQGTNYKTAIMAILTSAGVGDWGLIEDTSLTLARAKEFTPGTPKLDAINELLAAINYTPLWCDAYGYYRSSTYVSPATKQDDYKYIDDELSVTYAGASEELDLYGVANSWVAVLSNAEQTPLTASKVNDNPESPTSTVNRGRTIVDFREVDDIANQSALNAYVDRIAFEASQIFGKVTFETALMPFHEYQDVLYVRYLPLEIEDKYSETGWTMPLKTGGKMKHEVRKVVNI